MTWGSTTHLNKMKNPKRFRLPVDAPGKHESPALFEKRMERMAALSKARKRAKTEVRDGQKYKVLRLPEHIGL